MAHGSSPVQPRFENPREVLGGRLREGSPIDCSLTTGAMFSDDYFAACYTSSVKGQAHPARQLATVIVLEGLEPPSLPPSGIARSGFARRTNLYVPIGATPQARTRSASD
jgi:hypothetical protein